jgi:hypothetical protein
MIGPTSIAIFLAASLAAPVGASTDDQSEVPNQRWIELGSDEEGTDHLDMRTFERVGSLRRAWLRTTYRSPREDGATTVLYQFEMDCARRTHGLIGYARQRSDGSHIDAGTIPESRREIGPIVPDTTAELEYELLCQ